MFGLNPPSSFRIIGLTRIFEIWHGGTGWKQVSLVDLENGVYTLRIRYTDEDQKLINEDKKKRESAVKKIEKAEKTEKSGKTGKKGGKKQ